MSRSLFFSFGLMAGLLWAGAAAAEPSAADRATARSLAGEGYQALQDKDYGTAADRFSRADALVHAPTLMIDWARSLVGLGKLVEAQERYEQIVREGVDAKSPKSWQRALADAAAELAELKPRLAWVTLSTSGGKDVHVTIDDVEVPQAALGVRRAVNPGTRLVRVQAEGFLTQKRALQLAEGADEAAAFTLEPDPDARLAKQATSAPTPQPVVVKAHAPTAMYVAFGVSGAGFIVGGITGTLALSERTKLIHACNAQSVCFSDQTQTKRSYDTLGTISGVGFALGVAGAGAGLAFWLLSRHDKPAATTGLTIHPYLDVAGVGAVGSF